MVTSLLLLSVAVVSLLLVLVLPVFLLQRLLRAAPSIDEVEERWMRRFGDLTPPFLDAEAVRRLRAVSLRG